MKLMTSFLLLLGSAAVLSGCSTMVPHTSYDDNRALRSHIVTLTNQIQRMDVELQNSQRALTKEREENELLRSQIESLRGSGQPEQMAPPPKPESIDAIYKTPGGFEIPSKDIQQALKNAGYYNGDVDGEIGPGSRQAIRAFQKSEGLKVDSVVGPKTWERLKAHLST